MMQSRPCFIHYSRFTFFWGGPMLRIFGCLTVLCAAVAVAQTNPAASANKSPQKLQQARAQQMAELLKDYRGPKYVRSEVMIPVRDGVELHTVILRPEGSD